MARCAKCGASMRDGSSFCPNCGEPVSGDYLNGIAPQPAGIAPARYHELKRRKQVSGLIMAVFVLTLGIGALGVGWITIHAGSDTEEEATVPETQAEPEAEQEAAVEAPAEEPVEEEEQTGEVEVKDSVEEYTWEELSTIADEISAATSASDAMDIAIGYNLTNSDGTLDGTQTKSVKLSNGSTVDVQIIGFYHDNLADSGRAGITFMFSESIDKRGMNSSGENNGGWKSSDLRGWLNSDGLAMLPEDLQSEIKTVIKSTNNTGMASEASVVTSTEDKLWLLALTEIVGECGEEYEMRDIYNAEGSQYQFFENVTMSPFYESNYDALSYMVRKYDGYETAWWERTARPKADSDFFRVGTDGYPDYGEAADDPVGVLPCFCL